MEDRRSSGVALISSRTSTAQPSSAPVTTITPQYLPPQDVPLTSNGVDPSSLHDALTLKSGMVIDTAQAPGVRCFVPMGDGTNGNNGHCATTESIDAGEVVHVIDHCNDKGVGTRLIIGLVTTGVTGVTLTRADGSTEQADANDGVYAFEDELGANASVPVAVDWDKPTGTVVMTQHLPSGIPPGCLQRTS